MDFSQVYDILGTMIHLLDTITVQVYTMGRTRVTHEWDAIGCHRPPYSRLYYVHEGETTVNINDHTIRLRPDRLYLLPADQNITLAPPRGRFDHTWIHFHCRLRGGIGLFRYYLPVKDSSRDISEPLLQRTITKLNTLWSNYSTSPRDRLTFNAVILRWIGTLLSAEYRPEIDGDIQPFTPVLQYIQRHLDRPLPLRELAEIMHLNPTYFSNRFKTAFGQPPRDFIIERRLEKARHLLVWKDDPLKQVAAQVGFDDPFYFSRLFKQKNGISPSRYREQQIRARQV